MQVTLTCDRYGSKGWQNAVDPKVIPLGSQVYVEGHGWRIAEDVGGKVKGNIIDIFMGSRKEALNLG